MYVWVPSHGEKRFAALKLLRASTNATSHGRYASTRGCGSALRGVLQMLRRRSKRSRLPNRHRCRHRRPSQAAVSQRVAVLFASRRWRSPWQLFLAVIAFASAAACMFAVLCMYVCMYVFKYVRRLANIGRQPQGAALQYQKELASGNEIGRRTEQRCYPEKPRSQGLSKKWHGWAIRSQERTLPHSGTHVHCQDR